MLAALEAGCSAPVGAPAPSRDGVIELTAAVIAADGGGEVRGDSLSGPADDAADARSGAGRGPAAGGAGRAARAAR